MAISMVKRSDGSRFSHSVGLVNGKPVFLMPLSHNFLRHACCGGKYIGERLQILLALGVVQESYVDGRNGIKTGDLVFLNGRQDGIHVEPLEKNECSTTI